MDFFVALRFLTAVPLPARETIGGELGRSTAFFPLVGLVLGLILAGLDALAQAVFPVGVTSALVIVASMLLTGALHLDGFIDSCDGLFGRRDPARRLEIMRDSRVGSFGVVGAFGLLVVRFAALGALPEGWRTPALVLMPTAGRWAMVLALWGFPYARAQGLGRAFKEGVGRREVGVASLAALAIGALSLRTAGIASLIAVGIVTWLLGRFICGRVAGLTGDSYGAINEVTEVVSLLSIIALAGAGYG